MAPVEPGGQKDHVGVATAASSIEAASAPSWATIVPIDVEFGSGEVVTPSTVEMHRLYNPNSGEHFYTASAGERDVLSSIGWYGVA